jgi:hypothetical protein
VKTTYLELAMEVGGWEQKRKTNDNSGCVQITTKIEKFKTF